MEKSYPSSLEVQFGHIAQFDGSKRALKHDSTPSGNAFGDGSSAGDNWITSNLTYRIISSGFRMVASNNINNLTTETNLTGCFLFSRLGIP